MVIEVVSNILAIEMGLKAEDSDDDPVALAQFSPTAYVHGIYENSIKGIQVGPAKVGPATYMRYRSVSNQTNADVSFEPNSNQSYFWSSHSPQPAGQTHTDS